MRMCDVCGKRFTQGYINDGLTQYYYCSSRCVDVTYTPTEKKSLQDDGQLFFTTWEDD